MLGVHKIFKYVTTAKDAVSTGRQKTPPFNMALAANNKEDIYDGMERNGSICWCCGSFCGARCEKEAKGARTGTKAI
jgi:hypothetical protein